MNCKIVILSDKILRGETSLDISNLSRIMLGYGLKTKEIVVKKQNEKFDDFSSPTFLFLHDELIDDFVANNKVFYDSKSEIIDGEGILTGDKFPILVLPIESNLEILIKKSLDTIKERFNLQNMLIFRLYGLPKEKIEAKLREINLMDDCLVSGNGLLVDLYLKKTIQSDFISDNEIIINQTFGDNIYAQNDMSLAQVVAKMTSLMNVKIAISDAFTFGGVALNLLKTGMKNLCSETFNYSIENGFIKTDLDSKYRDENEMINKLSFALLEKKKVNLALVLAGRKIGSFYHVYIALGSKKSTEVYNLSIEGSQEDAIQVAINSTLFNLIKKLRIKDFENL